jgi:hypothetical protein
MGEETPSVTPRQKRQAISRKEILSGAAAELLMLIETVTADGIITDDEAKMLNQWLDDREVAGLPSIEYLRTILHQVLDDGQITHQERTEIYKALEKVLPPDLRKAAKERRQATEAIARAKDRDDAEQRKAAEKEAIAKDKPVKTLRFQTAGVSHEGRGDVVSAYAKTGDTVYLVRERYNSHDSNAIRILLRQGYQIGYVPREDAAEIAPYLDRGFFQKAVIQWISNGRRYQIPGISASIYRSDTTIRDAVGPHQLPALQSAPESQQSDSYRAPTSQRAGAGIRSYATESTSSGCGCLVMGFLCTVGSITALLLIFG